MRSGRKLEVVLHETLRRYDHSRKLEFRAHRCDRRHGRSRGEKIFPSCLFPTLNLTPWTIWEVCAGPPEEVGREDPWLRALTAAHELWSLAHSAFD